MKHLALFILPFVLLHSCSSEAPKKTVTFNENEVTKTEDGLMMKQVLVSANQFKQSKEVKLGGHQFDAVIENKDTTYLATSDSLFLTPENFHTGMRFSEIPANLRKNMRKETGWGYYVKLASGWNLGFCEGAGCTDMEPTDFSKVKWIFKRN